MFIVYHSHHLYYDATGRLTIADLKVVRSTLWEARSRWKDVGIELDLLITDLDAIESSHGANIGECFTKMLTSWLKRIDPPPTWSTIVAALQQPTLDLQQLAEEVEEMHVLSDSNGASAEVAKLAFPHIREIVSDDPTRKRLEQRLRNESKDIMMEFRVLQIKCFNSIEDQKIPVEKLVECLDEEIGDSLQKNLIDSEPETFEEVKQFIKANSSFFNYHLIKYMIKVVGTDKDKDQLEEYEKAFHHYAKRRVYECPAIFSATKSKDSTELQVKLDSKYDKQTLEEAMEFEGCLCAILNISVYVCPLKDIQRGCFVLTFTIPQCIQQAKFPLTEDQERALQELQVIQLTCGNYTFPKPNDQVLSYTDNLCMFYAAIMYIA